AWTKHAPKLVPVFRRVRGLAWFKNEHDETPAAVLSELSVEEVGHLADALTRTSDGPLVPGRVVSAQAARVRWVTADEAFLWKPADYARAARETFGVLAPLYRLR